MATNFFFENQLIFFGIVYRGSSSQKPMCSSRMFVNFCWTEWSITLLYRLEVRSGDAGCYRLFYGCCWLMLLEHVQEEGPSNPALAVVVLEWNLLGEKKKKKRKNPQQKVHTPEDRTTMMIFCVYAKPVAEPAAGVLWLVLQHGPQQDGRRRNRSSRPY